MYRIGFYNEKVDDPEILSDCDKVFNNYGKLKKHLRSGDTIKLASIFSLFGIDMKDFLSLKSEYDLTIIVSNTLIESSSINDLTITLTLAINQLIADEKENILKLLTK